MDQDAVSHPPRINSALIPVSFNNQEMLALLNTRWEVDRVSDTAMRGCHLPVHSLPQLPRLRFSNGRQYATIGKTMSVKCGFLSTTGPINLIWDFFVARVHHGMILGMPWMTQ